MFSILKLYGSGGVQLLMSSLDKVEYSDAYLAYFYNITLVFWWCGFLVWVVFFLVCLFGWFGFGFFFVKYPSSIFLNMVVSYFFITLLL